MRDRQTDGRQTTDGATETEGSHTKCASLIILLNFYSLLSKTSLPVNVLSSERAAALSAVGDAGS